MDSKELVKKASLLAIGSFFAVGTFYLGYKKLIQNNSTPIDSNNNYLTALATTILLPAIALTAN